MKRIQWFLAFLILFLLCTPMILIGVSRPDTPQTSPANPELDILIKRAESMVARKLYDDAIETYAKCIAMAPRDATLYNRLGVAYHRKQDFKLARKNYEKAIKLDPNYAEALNNLGTVAFAEKKYDKAIRFYKKAVKLKPDAATMHFNLGSAWFAKEDYDKAFPEYQIAFTQDPDLMEHISATGSMVRTAGFNRAKYHFYLAKIYAEMGNVDRAIDYLARAMEEGFKETDLLYKDQAFAALIKDEKFARLMQNPPKPIE
jgi:tetratricopeptide (TPR) repeat protein